MVSQDPPTNSSSKMTSLEPPPAKIQTSFMNMQPPVDDNDDGGQWSNFCVVEALIGKMTDIVDIVCLCSVCKNWHRQGKEVVQFPRQQIPWLLLPYDYLTDHRSFFDPSKCIYRNLCRPEFCGKISLGCSPDGWMVLQDMRSTTTCAISLFNPFSGSQINGIPPLPPQDEGDPPMFIHEGHLSASPRASCNLVVRTTSGVFFCTSDRDGRWQEWRKINDQEFGSVACHGDAVYTTHSSRVLRIYRAGQDQPVVLPLPSVSWGFTYGEHLVESEKGSLVLTRFLWGEDTILEAFALDESAPEQPRWQALRWTDSQLVVLLSTQQSYCITDLETPAGILKPGHAYIHDPSGSIDVYELRDGGRLESCSVEEGNDLGENDQHGLWILPTL